MIRLFIKSAQVKETASLSSATDEELIDQKIYYAQISDINRILGQSLYAKMLQDIDNLQGVYKVIFDSYLVDMHVFYTMYYFTLFNEVKQSNVGNTILGVANDKTNKLADNYRNLAVSIEDNFRNFMQSQNIPEWKCEKKNEETTNISNFY